MKSKSFLMILILLILPAYGFAQSPYGEDVVEIVIEKGGQLENKLKKSNALNTTKLSLISPEKYSSGAVLNEKDFTFLSGLSQLEELYIDVDIDGNKFNTSKFLQKNGRLTNTNFPNLKKFGFGERPRQEVKDLFYLKVSGLVFGPRKQYHSFRDTYFPDGIKFEDVYIVSKPEEYSLNGFVEDDREKNWLEKTNVVNNTSRIMHEIKIHAIHVDNRDWLASAICSFLNPAVIYIHTKNGDEKYLANYQSVIYEEDKDLEQYDGILPRALTNSSFDTLRLPDKQTVVGWRFFDNVSARQVDLNKIRTIGKEAFYNSHIKIISLPATVQDIDEKAFDNSEIETVFLEGKYAPAISVGYVPEGFENIQFIIPKGAKGNYNIGVWKKLRVLEDGASTNYTFDVKEPGTLASLLTDDIKQTVVSLKLRGILFSDDIKLLEDCPNLRFLDLAETFIAQSPKELREKQETSDYLAGVFMNMGVIAQSEFEHDRISTTDNLRVQYLAKLGEMAKNEQIESDPNCQLPRLDNTRIEELIFPLQLQKVVGYALPRGVKKIVLPPDLKEFSASPYANLSEITLPSSVTSVNIKSSNIDYSNLQTIDLSSCIDPKIELDAKFKKLHTLKLPELYQPEYFNGSKRLEISTSTPIEVYFKGRQITPQFRNI